MKAQRPAKPLRSKRRVTEVALGAHANAGLRAHVPARRLSRKLVRKPKVCRPTVSAASTGDVILRNYAILNAVFTPVSLHVLRLASLARRSPDHMTTELPGFWDALSAPGLYRKIRPTLRLDSGTQFPFDALMGKHVPLCGSIPGCSFRWRCRRESVSRFGAEIRDTVSA